jgi:hypothetical protein
MHTPHVMIGAVACSLMLAVGGATMTQESPPGASLPAAPFPTDYRSWRVVRSIVVGPEHGSFATRGGIHHYYANEKAIEGYRTGVFADGSVIVDEGVSTKEGEGQGKGILFETERRSIDVMVKDQRLYKDSGGWGFDHFDGQATTSQATVARRTQCFECHTKRKDRDYVFTTIRP